MYTMHTCANCCLIFNILFIGVKLYPETLIKRRMNRVSFSDSSGYTREQSLGMSFRVMYVHVPTSSSCLNIKERYLFHNNILLTSHIMQNSWWCCSYAIIMSIISLTQKSYTMPSCYYIIIIKCSHLYYGQTHGISFGHFPLSQCLLRQSPWTSPLSYISSHYNYNYTTYYSMPIIRRNH